jgi:hypothetical protein
LDVTINLDSDPGVTFDPKTPLAWTTGTPPTWITTPSVKSPTQIAFTILTDPGKSASFQFAINLKNNLGNNVTVFSTDPIIINATIGDG